MKIDMFESDTAKELKSSMIILGIGKPPANVQSSQLFSKMQDKINEKLKKSTIAQEEPLLLKPGTQLVPKEWKTLDKINSSLFDDYHVRRKTLITRCDCTIGSFKWKEGDQNADKNLSEKIDASYGKLRTMLDPKPTVSLAHGLAARKSGCFDLLNSVVSKSHQICDIETPKTKGMANVGKQQRISLQKFLIGNVPDRGGRPKEQVNLSHNLLNIISILKIYSLLINIICSLHQLKKLSNSSKINGNNLEAVEINVEEVVVVINNEINNLIVTLVDNFNREINLMEIREYSTNKGIISLMMMEEDSIAKEIMVINHITNSNLANIMGKLNFYLKIISI